MFDSTFNCFNTLKRIILAAMLVSSWQAFAVDPFEDFHEYGQLSEEEIH